MGMVLQEQHSSQHWPFLGASGWGAFTKGKFMLPGLCIEHGNLSLLPLVGLHGQIRPLGLLQKGSYTVMKTSHPHLGRSKQNGNNVLDS